ncbi:MAG: shikimate kinase AroL [Deltaproteobacteria bacterium]|nr:shikimate kinase AroL [Deltaproteobacteria bacterium]
MKENVFLVGPRAVGKTTLGRMLAAELGLVFVDTDEEIKAETNLSVVEIVAEDGWEAFRRVESRILARVAEGCGQVVATGGGAILSEGNRELLRRRGVVFYLMAEAATLARRLEASPESGQRPSLTGVNPAQEVARVLAEREPLYMAVADHIMRTEDDPKSLIDDARLKMGL